MLTEDWFFCSHFMDRALAAKSRGFDVVVSAHENSHAYRIRAAGLRFVPIGLERHSTNPHRELKLLIELVRLYWRERPAIVHQIGAKPLLYGSMAARLTGISFIVNAPIGMGYVFTSSDSRVRLLRFIMQAAYRVLVNPPNSKVIFENPEDLKTFIDWRAVARKDGVLIKGAGVDLEIFRPVGAEHEVLVVVLPARLLIEKGVNEFVRAAHLLHGKGVIARFVLSGAPDPLNPSSISEELLKGWSGRQGVEWWGWSDDMPGVLSQADIVCLPSYREGLPKALIEAAACGLPIVTTDATGCREVVDDGVNGFLVPIGSVDELASALQALILDPALRRRMGRQSRLKSEREFGSGKIIAETLSVYDGLLSGSK